MKLKETTLYYVSYPIGSKPMIESARISLETWDDVKYFFKTPFAMIDCYRDPDEVTVEDLIRMAGPGYHRTREESQVYLEMQYPYRDHWANEEIHHALSRAIEYRGGAQELAEITGTSVTAFPTIFDLARGRVRATAGQAGACQVSVC